MSRLEQHNLISNINSDYFETWGAMSGSPHTAVYVEGWDDVAFWRSVFDDFEYDGPFAVSKTSCRRFEIMTPARNDMAKGKKVVLGFADQAGKGLLLCVDSDFDYLFDQATAQSRVVNNHPFVVQTYTYAIENLLCLPSSLASIAAKITKNDTPVFDFEEFFARYSTVIYPLFLWYVFASHINRPNLFTLTDFRNTVRLNHLHLEDNGERTLSWVDKQVRFRLSQLRKKHSAYLPQLQDFEKILLKKGVLPQETHLYMQGHTLQDNIVKIILQTVCNELRNLAMSRIVESKSEPLTKRNEMGSYNNALRDIDTVIADNVTYKRTVHYTKITDKIQGIFA
ncbi:MAG: DUF4435 domain-containing protein [Mucinivorans sp.]